MQFVEPAFVGQADLFCSISSSISSSINIGISSSSLDTLHRVMCSIWYRKCPEAPGYLLRLSFSLWFFCLCRVLSVSKQGKETRRSDLVSTWIIAHKLSSQRSNNPYWANSPNRHESVIVESPNEHPPLLFTRQWRQWWINNSGQLRDLNQRLSKAWGDSSLRAKPLPTSQDVAIAEDITTVAPESKS